MDDTILIGEDDSLQRRMISLMLRKQLGYKTLEAADGQAVVQQVEASNLGEISAVLLDMNMPDATGLEVLARIRKYRPDIPVIILTAMDDATLAVKAIKAGASDFIVKPPEPALLDIAIKNAIRMSVLSRELTRLKRDKQNAMGFADLIGAEGGLAEAVAYGRKAAASDVTVMITGETSTGKELMARAIHGESRRVGGPFAAINCGAVAPESLEAELFGYEKDALPGTSGRSLGLLRETDRGTIFLDDIHLLPPSVQIKLLRVLQEKEVEPLGATKPVKVNVRLISATHHDLRAEVAAERFREDLYFRLNVLTIDMPSLRERREDIVPLVEYFLQRIAAMDGLAARSLAPDARHYLSDYAWPGNVRELEGLLHRALVLSDDGPITRAQLMQIHDVQITAGEVPGASEALLSIRQPNGLFKTMEAIETEAMQLVLAHYGHNVTRAAEALGIAKSTFYRKMKLPTG